MNELSFRRQSVMMSHFNITKSLLDLSFGFPKRSVCPVHGANRNVISRLAKVL